MRFARYDNGPMVAVKLADVVAYGRWVWWRHAMGWLQSQLYVTGIVSSGWFSSFTVDEIHRWSVGVYLDFHPRPYVLWRQRKFWFHWPRFGHGYYEVMGMCGKCCPWPCCDSVDYDHAADCVEVSAGMAGETPR